METLRVIDEMIEEADSERNTLLRVLYRKGASMRIMMLNDRLRILRHIKQSLLHELPLTEPSKEQQ